MDQKPVLEKTPHLYVDQKKPNFLKIIGTIFLSLVILGSIPLGIYLTTHKTNFFPQAQENIQDQNASPSQPSVILSSDSNSVSTNQEFDVNLSVKESTQSANAVMVKIKYPQALLKVEKIATSSATEKFIANQWLQADFDNSNGIITLIGGAGNPGFKSQGNQAIKLASIHFSSNASEGEAQLEVQQAKFLTNDDNQEIAADQNKLNIKIATTGSFSASPIPTASASPNLSLKITNPKGGESFSYFKPVNITWDTSKEISRILSIDLYINGDFFGKISSNRTNNNQFLWTPQRTLILPYIKPDSVYEIGVRGISRDGTIVSDKTLGPFGLVLDEENTVKEASSASDLSQKRGDLNGDGTLDVKDFSVLMSSYNQTKLKNDKTDLNGDKLANGIDLWILKAIFASQGIIASP